ncbi:MAG: trigger factor [Lachnospiraceae bacterium]|nr:trigger factor [Lachnospiraceae bacterium]
MKRFPFIIKYLLLFIVLALLCGCGKKKSAKSELGFDPLDYIELGEYKGLSVTRVSTDVTEEDIDKYLNSLLASTDTYRDVTDRDILKKGDVANIDFVGKKDGVAFEGGTGEGYDLEIGSNTFIPGFEDGMIGMKVGEKRNLDLTFPENYQAESLAGQAVVFEVTLNSIKEKVVPEVTDEAVNSYTNGEYETIEAYKVKLKEDLTADNIQYADSAMYTDLWEQAVSNATVKGELPKDLLNEKKELLQSNALSYAESYGMTLEEFYNLSLGLTGDDFTAQLDDYALRAAKETLVLYAIADAEGLSVSDKDLQDGIDDYVTMYNYPSKEEFIKSVDMNEFKEYILESKVQEFLADNAVIAVSEDD